MSRILVVRKTGSPEALDSMQRLSNFLVSQNIEHVLLESSELPLYGYAAGNNQGFSNAAARGILCSNGDLASDTSLHTPVNCCGKSAKSKVDLANSKGDSAKSKNCLGLDEEFDFAVALGGDGTILRTACFVAKYSTPILGLNFGHLGFLTEDFEGGVEKAVSSVLEGNVIYDHRTNLHIDVFCEDYRYNENEEGAVKKASYKGNKSENDSATLTTEGLCKNVNANIAKRHSFFALNEISLQRKELGKVAYYDLRISGQEFASIRGDGIVVSTPTGSTAYSLSAGGPIVAPSNNGLLVEPLNPHSIMSRSLVTGPDDVVEISIPKKSDRYSISLLADGIILPLDFVVERIAVCRGENPTTLIHFKENEFYGKVARVFL